MSNLNADIRIVNRIVDETVKGIKRSRWMNVIIIATMAAILSIFGCFFRSSIAISDFVDYLGDSLEVSVYLKNGYSPESVKKEILDLGEIQDVEIITKEQAWEDFKKQMDVPDIDNPLPDTLHIKVKSQEEIKYVTEKVKKIDAVEDIHYSKDIVDKILKISSITNVVAVIVLLVLGGLTLSIINNTIHLVIQSRSQEIEIMRMMGIGNTYIRAPYILQGAFYGFSGALISVIPVLVLEKYLNSMFLFFNIPSPPSYITFIILTLLAIGTFVGSLGSFIAVRKYLRI